MRVLHTADWHLGSRFHDRRRHDDEEDALAQLVELCAGRQVDVVLIAGDVFDNANPGAEEQERYFRCLARLTREAGVASVVMIAGNHDSALRLAGPRQLLAPLGIAVIGRLERDTAIDDTLVPLVDRQGRTRAVAMALPYLRDADLRLAASGESAAQVPARYRAAMEERYRQAHEAAASRHPGLPRIVLGHCLVDGAFFGGGERPVQVGNLGAVSAEILAGDAAYLALGHLHKPQAVGKLHWRYSGSLLPNGFDEVGVGRAATLFRLDDEGRATDVESIELRPWRRYARLHGKIDQLRNQVFALEMAPKDAPTPFCEAVLDLDRPEPGLAQELIELCRARGWDLVSVRRERPAARAAESKSPEAFSLHELEPEEVFVKRHLAEFGQAPDEDLLLDFRRLLEGLAAAPPLPAE